ncbi:hypothetical protein AB0L97_32765 [Nocardia sp. NPDC051911]|uniref:hypothetical protein n=1 Tax=Nocardia sp. NPDC051911 TaxID=3154648 RepID=UPI003438378F
MSALTDATLTASRQRRTIQQVHIRVVDESELTLGQLRLFLSAAQGLSDEATVSGTSSFGVVSLTGLRVQATTDAGECDACHGVGATYTDDGFAVCETCGGSGDPSVDARAVEDREAVAAR